MEQRPRLSDYEDQPHTLDTIDGPIDREEVLRYIGYPSGYEPSGEISREVDCWVEQASKVAQPRASFVMLPLVGIDKRSLRLESRIGVTEFAGAIGEFLGKSNRIAAFIATAGSGIEKLAKQQEAEGNLLAALVINAVGAERAEAAEFAVIEKLRIAAADEFLAPTLPYAPGYCGMALTEQRKLFGLFEGVDTGVTLNDHCLMSPLKSVSGLIGLGPAEIIKQHGSPCQRCDLKGCSMRR